MYIGLLIKFSRPYTAPNYFPKKSSIVVWLADAALQYDSSCGFRSVNFGWRHWNPSNHARPAHSFLKGGFPSIFSTILYAISITVSLLSLNPMSKASLSSSSSVVVL